MYNLDNNVFTYGLLKVQTIDCDVALSYFGEQVLCNYMAPGPSLKIHPAKTFIPMLSNFLASALPNPLLQPRNKIRKVQNA